MRQEILIVDDEPDMATLIANYLRSDGHQVTVATSGGEARAWLERQPFAVVLTDLVMDGVGGLDVLRDALRLQPATRVVLMSAFTTVESAIAALRDGAYDYLTKPFRLADMASTVKRALDLYRLGEENQRLRRELERQHGLADLLGVSEAMQQLKAQIVEVARSEASVVVQGESGTGKELVARAVHSHGQRRAGPFVAVNCAALPETLLESELFGHEKGAFTGALQKTRGLFGEAQGGTIFLDEIGDMPLPLQAKLLRVLQDKAVRPVGGSHELRVDVRVISATNRALGELVKRKKFREDLFYRLAVLPLDVPSLRERPDDIPVLARHFVDRAARRVGKTFEGLSDEAEAWLVRQRWPGNVRQLENAVERAVTLAAGPGITLDDFRVGPAVPGSPDDEPGARPTLAELEHDYIRRVLRETKGDKRLAAHILGVSVRTIQRKVPRPRDDLSDLADAS